MNIENAIRKGLPSASNAEADSLCPGRFLAQYEIPEIQKSAADYGTLVHKAFAGEDVELDPEQERTVELGRNIEDMMLTRWMDGQEYLGPYREKRLWLHDTETLDCIASGQIDAFWVSGKRALIEDLKSLFGDVTESASNLQLRDYVVMLNEGVDYDEVSVFINQPRVTTEPKLVVYNREDVARAREETVARVKRSIAGGPRIAGEKQCKFCRAAASCPECIEWMQKEIKDAPVPLTPKTADQWVGVLSPDQLALIQRKATTIRNILDAVTARLKTLPAERLAELGFELGKGHVNRPINDLKALCSRLKDVCSEEELFECFEASKSKIEKLLREKTSLKGKALKEKMESLLEGITDEIETAPVLKAIKEANAGAEAQPPENSK